MIRIIFFLIFVNSALLNIACQYLIEWPSPSDIILKTKTAQFVKAADNLQEFMKNC